MFRLLYSVLFALCMPFVFAKLLWRGYKAPEYRSRRLERFGVFKVPALKDTIWIHAVSVGEVLAAEPIIRELQRAFPARSLVVTSMTPTSSALIQKLFGDSVFHVYAPYDLPFLVKAFLRRVQPRFLIIMETELWPNMIHHARQNACSVVLANARLSERSAAGYRRLKPAVGWMLNELSLVLCQYANDAQRFASLGIEQQKIHVTGSVKYDIELDESLPAQGDAIRAGLSPGQPVWIAASTHEGEDELMLRVHQQLRKSLSHAVLILVPRHPERFEAAYRQACDAGFCTGRRTDDSAIPADCSVFVVNTMGELMRFYAAADVAVIGGSFAEVGGHNPIEPAALGLPILMGPHIFNFEAICQQMMASGGLEVLPDESALRARLQDLLSQPELAQAMGQKVQQEVAAGRGAKERVMTQLRPLIERS